MAITAYTTTFTPICTGTLSTAGVTTAATAYDWFGAAGTLGTAIGLMSTGTAAGLQNKAFVQSIAQHARLELLPLVKAELFAAAIANPASVISSFVTNANSLLTSIQLSGLDTATKTAIATSYTSTTAGITAALNRVKSLEQKTYATGDSIDVTTAAATTGVNAVFAATATATTFTANKTPLSALLDPATLGNGGTAIPVLTASTYANAATLGGYYTAASTALTASTLTANLNALVEMSAQNVFDLWCINAQGYSAAGTTGVYTGSAPVGIVPGVDYEVHLTGAFQTGTAASGTAGAPSATVAFW
jgi:hypothetical protein